MKRSPLWFKYRRGGGGNRIDNNVMHRSQERDINVPVYSFPATDWLCLQETEEPLVAVGGGLLPLARRGGEAAHYCAGRAGRTAVDSEGIILDTAEMTAMSGWRLYKTCHIWNRCLLPFLPKIKLYSHVAVVERCNVIIISIYPSSFNIPSTLCGKHAETALINSAQCRMEQGIKGRQGSANHSKPSVRTHQPHTAIYRRTQGGLFCLRTGRSGRLLHRTNCRARADTVWYYITHYKGFPHLCDTHTHHTHTHGGTFSIPRAPRADVSIGFGGGGERVTRSVSQTSKRDT